MNPVETVDLAPCYVVSRVIRGGWQLAGGHGAIDAETAIADLLAAYDAGITTFDCADIYTGVEALLGAFRARLAALRGEAAAASVKIHTKLVPDLDTLPGLRKPALEAIVDRSLARLGVDRLDLVQFHWWDYAVPGVVQAMLWLDQMRAAGKIRFLGGTNFDAAHTRAILDAGVPLLSMQTQYSVLDRRPAGALAAVARASGMALLCYGSVAGGFLGDRWLGAPDPAGPLENRSLVKYRLIIEEFGGWDLFQSLLRCLRGIADRHGADIASVAGRWVLDQPCVGAVIVGGRSAAHISANARLSALRLTALDRQEIAAVLAQSPGLVGEPYALERDRNGRHGAIMLYGLNATPTKPRMPS